MDIYSCKEIEVVGVRLEADWGGESVYMPDIVLELGELKYRRIN